MFIWIALKMFVGEVISGVLWLIPRLLFLFALTHRDGGALFLGVLGEKSATHSSSIA